MDHGNWTSGWREAVAAGGVQENNHFWLKEQQKAKTRKVENSLSCWFLESSLVWLEQMDQQGVSGPTSVASCS